MKRSVSLLLLLAALFLCACAAPTETGISSPSQEKTEETVALSQTTQEKEPLTRLMETYYPDYAGSIEPKSYSNVYRLSEYRSQWEKEKTPVTFKRLVDKYGVPYSVTENEGSVVLEYWSPLYPSFFFVMERQGEEPVLTEIRSDFVQREDLTFAMVDQLREGESTMKEVCSLLGSPHGFGSGLFFYSYKMADGGSVTIRFTSEPEGLPWVYEIVKQLPQTETVEK